QIAFGFSVAAVYGLLMVTHVVFGLFFALSIVCAVRGLGMYAARWVKGRARKEIEVGAPALVREA
ncbi:MAG TPA: hypothetical protein VF435_05245, partial [Pyrinomonadaceae bacterium]